MTVTGKLVMGLLGVAAGPVALLAAVRDGGMGSVLVLLMLAATIWVAVTAFASPFEDREPAIDKVLAHLSNAVAPAVPEPTEEDAAWTARMAKLSEQLASGETEAAVVRHD
jgi:hypothetical protein